MSNLDTLQQKHQQLLEKKRELEVKQRSLHSRSKAEERKLDARRKIIVGGAVIAAFKAGALDRKWLEGFLDTWVTREKDREVVGLEGRY